MTKAKLSSAGDGDVRTFHCVDMLAFTQSSVLINLPICLFALVVLLFSLNKVQLTRATNASWSSFLRKFDFGGL